MFSKTLRYSAFIAAWLLVFAFTGAAYAQAVPSSRPNEVDLAAGYNATRQNGQPGGVFWQQGGFIELSADAWHGFGMAARVDGGKATNVNGNKSDINTVNVVFGPHYTFRHRRLALFGEGLMGEANAFSGSFPSQTGAISSTNSFAVETNGGADFILNRRFAVRILEVGWQRSQFPNSAANVQNALTLGAGICIRLHR